jgi:DNA-binding transcriptional ArsR family regulator
MRRLIVGSDAGISAMRTSLPQACCRRLRAHPPPASPRRRWPVAGGRWPGSVGPNLLSYHLRVLREARLVTATRRGRWIDYALADDALDRLHAALPVAAGSACGCG